MADLSTVYLGLDLAHPIVASASPLSASFDGMRRLEDAQAAAVVMLSLYEEQVRAADTKYAVMTEHTAGLHPEAGTYFPELPEYRYGVSGHLETLRRAADALDIPVIASLNGISDNGWLDLAVELEQAGAAAIELNLYLLPPDPSVTAPEVEHRYLDIIRHVTAEIQIPVSVKLAPFFTALGNFVQNTESAGARGIVLFNRFFRPDINLNTFSVEQRVVLSTPDDISLPLTWTALLSRQTGLSIAAGSGIESHIEVVKFLLAGADVVTTASSLLRHGPEHMITLVDGLKRWLDDNAFSSIRDIQGRLDATRTERADLFLREQHRQALSDFVLRHPGLRAAAE